MKNMRIVLSITEKKYKEWIALARKYQLLFGVDENKKNESGIHWGRFFSHVMRSYETSPISFSSQTREKLFTVSSAMQKDLDTVVYEAMGLMEVEYEIKDKD